MAGYKLSEDAAKRTKRAVLRVEKEFADLSGPSHRGHSQPLGFWAKITKGGSYDISGTDDYKYSWECVEMQSTGLWQSKTEWGTGSRTNDKEYAVECIYRSAFVPEGSIVWMYPALNQDFYLFNFEGRPRQAKTTSEITAQSGATLGKGKVKFEKQTVDNIELDSTSPRDMLAYNKSGAEIDTDKRVVCIMINGRWHIIFEDCST